MLGSLVVLLVFSLAIDATPETFKTACELLKLPRDCHCQRTRGVPNSALNETRLRCRQLIEVTNNLRWSIVPYDRLAFETPNDNLTLYPFAFADVRARTLRFDVQHLMLTDRALDNAYIGQLAIARPHDYGTIHFEMHSLIFYGTTITNLFIKSIDFQRAISETIFSNSRIYSLVIQTSKFYGFTNKKHARFDANEVANTTESEHDNFLEYDFPLTANAPRMTDETSSSPLKIHRKKKKKPIRHLWERNDDSSSQQTEQTITINITAINLPAFVTFYSVLASINTSQLTEHYFANNIDYSQTDAIELSDNWIDTIGAHAFRHLHAFEGRLILRNNHIQSIDPFAFADLYSITNLSLTNNHLQYFSSRHFEQCQQLIELDLSGNEIQYLNGSIFQNLTHLNVLRLNGNPLRYIDGDVLKPLSNLKELHLQGVQLLHSMAEQYSPWLWTLADRHTKHSLRSK
jgi:hypothetical protein